MTDNIRYATSARDTPIILFFSSLVMLPGPSI